MFTLESVQKMNKDGLFKYEFSILGIPQYEYELESWLKDFQTLRLNEEILIK